MPETASFAWAGPPREAIARARTRSRDVLGGKRGHRGDHALAEQEDRGALADAVADRADRLRQRRRRDGEDHQIRAGELDLGGPLHGQGVGQLDAGEVALVRAASRTSPLRAPRCGCRAGPRARLSRAAPRRRFPSSRLRSRRPCAAEGGRPATPTGARSRARSGRRPSWRAPARGLRSAGRSVRGPCGSSPCGGGPASRCVRTRSRERRRAGPPRPVSSARRPKPRFGRPREPVRMRVPSGKMQTTPPRLSTSREVISVSSSDCPRRTG